jgi:transposase
VAGREPLTLLKTIAGSVVIRHNRLSQRMDISSQQKPIGYVVGCGSPIGPEVGTFQGRCRIKSGDSAPPAIGFQQRRPEPGLSRQVPAVVMEATSDYWKGPFYRLEAEGFECVLADAKQVKNLPGRPRRDPADSRWLAACFERGAITACFVATPEFRIIRLHTRCRRDLTQERTREKQRAEKLLESAAIKISSVVTDLHGVTGRDIMDHLIAGERNPKVLAQLARAAARRKIAQLEEARPPDPYRPRKP